MNYSVRRPVATRKETILSLASFVLLFQAFDAKAQAPYQPQDPVVTAIPSRTIGLPTARIDNAKQQRVYNQLLNNYSLLDTKDSGGRAKSLFETILDQIGSPSNPAIPMFGDCRPGPGLLIHIAIWHVEPFGLTDGKTPRTFVLTHSEWHGYQWQPSVDNILGTCALKVAERPDGSPSFLGAKCIYFLGINAFDSQMYGSRVTVDYKLSELPQTPLNLNDLSAAASAVTGVQLTAPTGSASAPSAPTPIDNGTNGYQGTLQSTVMVNLSQTTLPTSPVIVSSLQPTSAAPYTINPTFFLQFQPSPLQVTQGTKLGKPDATAGGAASTGGGQSDTTLYLNDHLEQLLPKISKPSIAQPVPTVGKPVPLTLGPLPPGLTFESDAELAYEQFEAQHQPLPTSGPPQAHGDALEAIAASQKFEAVALLSALEASQAAQTLASLSKIRPERLFVKKPTLSIVDPCCGTVNPVPAASSPTSLGGQASSAGDACSPATPTALVPIAMTPNPDDDADFDFSSSPLHEYLDTLCHQALTSATDATDALSKENSAAQGDLNANQKALLAAKQAQTKSANDFATANADVDKAKQTVQDDANLLLAANDSLQNDKAQLCSVDFQHDALLPKPSPVLPDSAAIQPPLSAPASGTEAAAVGVDTAVWASEDGCGAAPAVPHPVVVATQGPAGVSNNVAPSNQAAPTVQAAPTTASGQQLTRQQAAVQTSLVQQSKEQAIDLARQRTQLQASLKVDQDLVNQRTTQQNTDQGVLDNAKTRLDKATAKKGTDEATVTRLNKIVQNQVPIATSLHTQFVAVTTAQTLAIATASPHESAEHLAQCALIELRVARYVSESGQRPEEFAESVASLQACQNYVTTLRRFAPATPSLPGPRIPTAASPMGCTYTIEKLSFPSAVTVVQWANNAPRNYSDKELSSFAEAVLNDIKAASFQAACYTREIDEKVNLINNQVALSQKDEIELDTADLSKPPAAASSCTTTGCCCCCGQGSPATAAPTPSPAQPDSQVAAPAGRDGQHAAAAGGEPPPAKPSDPAPTGGALRGISFRAGDFPLLLTLHSATTPYIPPIGSDPQSASNSSLRADSGQTNSCVLPTELPYGANDVPCVEFVALTSSVGSGGGVGGGSNGGGKGGQGGGGGGGSGGGNSAGGGSGSTAPLAPAQAVDCSRQSSASGPCAYSRSFMVDEPEWWDISLGLSIPGVKENTYTFVPVSSTSKTTGNCLNNTYTCSVKHHADAYALLDLYPFATNWFASRHNRRALFHNDAFLIPHLNAGIPITSQSLYRPYFGAAVNVSSPLQHRGFPIGVSLFAGLVDMKQTICDAACVQAVSASATATPTLVQDRALRGAFGVEVSITAIAGKVKGGASGGGASKSGSSH
jgi:uncharacterized membrane protein YgcG